MNRTRKYIGFWKCLVIIVLGFVMFSKSALMQTQPPTIPSVREDFQYTAAFLDIPLGVRALALGGQFSPIDNTDGSAFFWNPAAVASVKGNLISTMYSNQFGTIGSPLSSYFHIGYTQDLSNGFGVSVNWVRNSVSSIPLTGDEGFSRGEIDRGRFLNNVINGSLNLGEFNNADDALFLTFGKNLLSQIDFGWQYFKVPMELPIGVTLKYINQGFGGDDRVNFRGSGIGVDVGTMFKVNVGQLVKVQAVGDLALGLTIRDLFNTPVTWNTVLGTNSSIERSFLFHTSYKQQLNFISSSLLFLFTYNSKYTGSTSFGVEYRFQNLLTLRAGTLEGSFTVGAGIVLIDALFIDYAYQTSELGGPHRVGISMNLAKVLQ